MSVGRLVLTSGFVTTNISVSHMGQSLTPDFWENDVRNIQIEHADVAT